MEHLTFGCFPFCVTRRRKQAERRKYVFPEQNDSDSPRLKHWHARQSFHIEKLDGGVQHLRKDYEKADAPTYSNQTMVILRDYNKLRMIEGLCEAEDREENGQHRLFLQSLFRSFGKAHSHWRDGERDRCTIQGEIVDDWREQVSLDDRNNAKCCDLNTILVAGNEHPSGGLSGKLADEQKFSGKNASCIVKPSPEIRGSVDTTNKTAWTRLDVSEGHSSAPVSDSCHSMGSIRVNGEHGRHVFCRNNDQILMCDIATSKHVSGQTGLGQCPRNRSSTGLGHTGDFKRHNLGNNSVASTKSPVTVSSPNLSNRFRYGDFEQPSTGNNFDDDMDGSSVLERDEQFVNGVEELSPTESLTNINLVLSGTDTMNAPCREGEDPHSSSPYTPTSTSGQRTPTAMAPDFPPKMLSMPDSAHSDLSSQSLFTEEAVSGKGAGSSSSAAGAGSSSSSAVVSSEAETPRFVKGSDSVDERPILGTVTSYWIGASKQNWYRWDGKGIPNSTNKYKEDQKVSWHATPFEVRVERALAKHNRRMSQKRLFDDDDDGVMNDCKTKGLNESEQQQDYGT